MKQAKWIILLIFFLISILTLSSNVWWDSAVYIGIGKYIWSMGRIGLFEASRPLVWPAILGFIWRLGLNTIIFGKILQIILGMGCILLTYLIAEDLFDKKTAIFSAILLAFSPTFLFFSNKLLTAIPSTFFSLLAVYLFFKKNYLFAGTSFGIAFMTRFLQLFTLGAVILVILLNYKDLRDLFNKCVPILAGFMLIVAPYLVFNLFNYGDIFYPFLLQSTMTKFTGFIFHQPWWFYFVNLLKENFLILFFLFGLFLFFRNNKPRKTTVLIIFLVFFIFYNLIAHKEMRFVISFLPYLYIITSFGLVNALKNKRLLLILFVVIWIVQVSSQIRIDQEDSSPFQEYLTHKENVGNLWITNPVFVVNADVKVDNLMYYWTFDQKKADELNSNIANVDVVLFNSCDLYCEPYNKNCPSLKQELIGKLKENLREVYHDKVWECEHYIFEST